MAPSVEYILHLNKILILECEAIIEKISYEFRVYVSVYDRSLSRVISHKSMISRTQEPKGHLAHIYIYIYTTMYFMAA